MNTTTFRPLHDNILVKRKDPEKMTKGGLFIPDNKQAKNRFAEVLAVGPGKFVEGSSTERLPIDVQPGQVVFFRGTAGQEVELGDEEGLVVLRADEVDGVVEEP